MYTLYIYECTDATEEEKHYFFLVLLWEIYAYNNKN